MDFKFQQEAQLIAYLNPQLQNANRVARYLNDFSQNNKDIQVSSFIDDKYEKLVELFNVYQPRNKEKEHVYKFFKLNYDIYNVKPLKNGEVVTNIHPASFLIEQEIKNSKAKGNEFDFKSIKELSNKIIRD
eukprot:CAMPEP_0116894164 /NCGR_PEP_ID=MMETSP0467-20121206/4005_1 /TAXON_ID=283647 /ORGANISM="Mesodinium pulex, Strain SPMC105" /LENGTH=130 /DNA_ID=CAMNT_0004564255 /DNA_START=990 /DNA_END=1382 /DNA_ORIENTATION=+